MVGAAGFEPSINIYKIMRMVYAYAKGNVMQSQALPKKPTNLSLDQELLNDAKSLGINLSKAAETGLKSAVAQAKSELWKQENATAIKSANEWVEVNGLPLEKYRQF